MNQENVNNIFESLTDSLVHIAKNGTEEQINNTIKIMDEGFEKMNEVFEPGWFNREMSKIWRALHPTN